MIFKLRQWHFNIAYIRQMATAEKTIKVQVRPGVIVGQQRLSPNGKPFNCFRGVPYAVPPVGNLRFKSPVPLERFDQAELDCTKERDVAHQRDPFTQDIMGSENCLFLNVYAPQRQKAKPLPVMVYIHGGGFFFGSGNSDSFYPLKLMEEDVIVVTFNYRLGALGFLCLPEEGIWGNAGLKDQRLALQWVQDNIASFNGDPQNVTLFGESAGAASVHLHAYAQHAHKLFHKAIMQSGVANAEWVFQVNPAYKTRRLAELLGCDATKPSEILSYLQSPAITPMRILASTLPVLTPDERRRGLPLAFKPVIEHPTSPDIFVDKPILEALQEPDRLRMPTIIGYNSAEGIAMAVNAVKKLSDIDEDLARFVPRNIPVPMEGEAIQQLVQAMRTFYLKGGTLSLKDLDPLVALLSDYHFVVDMQHAAEMQVKLQPHAPLYFFRFDYVGGRNLYKRILQMEHLKGASHADELCYLFQSEGDVSKVSADDALLTERFCRLWANFARSSNPTPQVEDADIIGCKWTPVQTPSSAEDAFVLDYLEMNKQFQMKRNPEQERVEFWRSIYRSYQATDYSRLSAKL